MQAGCGSQELHSQGKEGGSQASSAWPTADLDKGEAVGQARVLRCTPKCVELARE